MITTTPPQLSRVPPSRAQKHTADNIEKWTKQALLDLELTAEKLLQPAQP